MVENLYETYKLFYGPFKLEFEKETKTKDLELTLSIFFSNYLPTIKLSTVSFIGRFFNVVCAFLGSFDRLFGRNKVSKRC